jgi:hypothetical protein
VEQIHYIYRVPTKEEIGRDREQVARTVHHAILQDYETGERQVKNARSYLVQAGGIVMSAYMVMVLGAD